MAQWAETCSVILQFYQRTQLCTLYEREFIGVLLCLTEIKLNYLKIVIHNRMHSVKTLKLDLYLVQASCRCHSTVYLVELFQLKCTLCCHLQLNYSIHSIEWVVNMTIIIISAPPPPCVFHYSLAVWNSKLKHVVHQQMCNFWLLTSFQYT
jgi:hypothetical protein